MSRGGLPALAALDVADPPAVWRRMGFAVGEDGACRLGGVEVRLLGAGPGRGIVGWALRARAPLPADLDGIPTASAAPGAAGEGPAHPNGALAIDHVVVATPDLRRTLGALEAAGMEVRRVREGGGPGRPLRQAFLWAGEVLVEVAGPPEPSGDGPAALWGMTVVAPGFDLLVASADPVVGRIRPAVQKGRRIATVRGEMGSTVPLAFMTPHVRSA